MRYAFHTLTLTVQAAWGEITAELGRLLEDWSFVRTSVSGCAPILRLTIHQCAPTWHVPASAHAAFRDESLAGFAHDEDYYLTDGTSYLHVQSGTGQATAWLAPPFAAQPVLQRQQFWAFGLLKLLRPHGFYGLHAAGVVTATGQGLLIVGASGSGKSTLTLGLLHQGWGYLSDDAVLLHQQSAGVEALALRRPFAVEAHTAAAARHLPCSTAAALPAGLRKLRVDIQQVFPEQYRPRCLPQVLLFSRIVHRADSTLRPLDRPRALQQLLAQSGPPLFDRRTMGHHLAVLNGLMHQAASYELLAGRDVYDQPGRLVSLLTAGEGAA